MFLSRSSLPYATLFLLGFSAQAVTAPTSLASIYDYTDEAGVRNFTNQLDAVPEKYRSRMTSLDLDLPPAIPDVPPPATADAPMQAADVRTVSAGGEYRMGNHDTRADGVRLAVEAAKRDALEQVATYLENVTEVRDLIVTRDDIRSYTAGIVKVLEETITTRVEQEHRDRADLTAEIDPHEVALAIAALRENDSAASELMALRAETDRLQEQLDATNRALAAAPSPDEVQQLSRQRDEMLNDLQATALVSQAWTSWAYPTPGFSLSLDGRTRHQWLLLQAQRLSPQHRHLARAQQSITAQTGTIPTLPPHASSLASRRSLLVPSSSFMHSRQAPPLLNQQGLPAKVGDIVVIPSARAMPPVIHHTSPQPQPYQIHPNHFWRPSPPNIQTSPSIPQQRPSVSSRPSGSYAGHRGGGGHSQGHGGGRGR
ncbi:MAG: hypothetical protein IPI70_17350 [Nitrospira sp.]|nr:hypothetical protein [Nitrospira sp.]